MVPLGVQLTQDQINSLNFGDPSSEAQQLGALIANALNIGTPFDVNVQLTSAAAAVAIPIIPDALLLPNQKVYISEIFVQVGGGTLWATTANVFIQDTAGSPIIFATIPVAGLGANAILVMGNAGITLGAAILTNSGGTAGKGLVVVGNANGTGSTLNVRVMGQIR